MANAENHLNSTMLQSIRNTFETMAFLEVFPFEDDGSNLPAEIKCASLQLINPVRGELKLSMPESMLQEIGEGLFSIPSAEMQEKILNDLLSELLNTVGGRFLSGILPPGTNFEIGIPEHEPDYVPESDSDIFLWNLRAGSHRFSFSLLCGSAESFL